MTLTDSLAPWWAAQYRALDSSRKKYEARVASAPNEAQRNFWRRAVARTNAKLDKHVEKGQRVAAILDA